MNIYFDNNATTPLHPAVIDAMARVMRDCYANPASQHAPGRKSRRVLEQARERILEILGGKTAGMEADQLIFTSGGTEANNLALFGLTANKPGPLVISPLEHPSVALAADELARRGKTIHKINATLAGTIDLESARKLVTPDVSLVSVMLANNETGVIQPIAELAALCQEQDVWLHTDAVQAVGKIPVHFRQLNVAAMTVAPHKFNGPLGIGALILRPELKPEPMLFGGFQQAGIRPGTESAVLAVGFQTALEVWLTDETARTNRLSELRKQLEAMLREGDPSAIIIGESSTRLPQTSNVIFPQVDRQALVMALDQAGVACSTGSACASGSSELSPGHLAMGLSEEQAACAIRFSLGTFTTAEDVAEGARRILNAIKQLRRRNKG